MTVKIGNAQVDILSDGSFSLEVGACFGVVPRKIWSRYVKENENNRVRMALNIPLIRTGEWSALIDAGVGRQPDERMAKIFEITKEDDLVDQVSRIMNPEDVDLIIHSHLHFDHMGHSFEKNGSISFPSAARVAQKSEYWNMLNTNEITRGSYVHGIKVEGFPIKEVSGDGEIREGLRVVKTGGHTSGHQAIIYENDGEGLIYFGDILPSTFNLKLPYITAIDTYPLETLETKRELIRLAIDRGYVCIFNHDGGVKAATLHGDLHDVKYEAVEV